MEAGPGRAELELCARLAERGQEGSHSTSVHGRGNIVVTRRGERRLNASVLFDRSTVAPRRRIECLASVRGLIAHGYHRCLAPRDWEKMSKLRSADLKLCAPGTGLLTEPDRRPALFNPRSVFGMRPEACPTAPPISPRGSTGSAVRCRWLGKQPTRRSATKLCNRPW